ncbi:hypothetical protein WA158_004313 [Blastocystis sp. Blastoise]
MADPFAQYSSIPCMLIFGTGTVTIQKFLTSVNSTGIDAEGNPEDHFFNKPWFLTELMFCGMLLCFIIFAFQKIYQIIFRKGIHKKISPHSSTVQIPQPSSTNSSSSSIVTTDSGTKKTSWTQYFMIIVPALCDLVATCLLNLGLFWISASIWQMLRGSMIIFSALISIIFLKKRYAAYEWISIASVVIGLVIVACASLINFGDSNSSSLVSGNTSETVFAIVLILFSQLVQATQLIIEEHLLRNVKAPATIIVGFEGLWGGIVGAFILVGIYYTPTDNHLVAKLFHEDTIDTFIMIGNNNLILTLVICYVFVILGYNLFAMMVTGYYSAVYRTILESVRTLCIWIVNIIIYYSYAVPSGNLQFGEAITWNSLIQLFGFMFTMFGTFTFKKVIKLPCLKYPE